MNFSQFINFALNVTRDYYNTYIYKTGRKIREKNIYIEHIIECDDIFMCSTYVISEPERKFIVMFDRYNNKFLSCISLKEKGCAK